MYATEASKGSDDHSKTLKEGEHHDSERLQHSQKKGRQRSFRSARLEEAIT